MPTSSKKKPSKIKKYFAARRQSLAAFMNRRPHRSFQRTRRRDYTRPIVLPGKIRFTAEVTKTLWKYKTTFVLLVVVYIGLYSLLVGAMSQSEYVSLSDTLKETSSEALTGNWGALGQAGLLFVSISSSNYGANLTEAQQLFAALIFLLTWLSSVWLLRNLLAGHKVKLRDGLYNSAAPLFATIIIVLLVVIQLIPVALAVIGYSAALATGMLAGGAPTMLFWLVAALLVVLSLYWVTSSLFALVIVTLPGMYPYRAIKTAGDLMLGRRVKILLHWVWMLLIVGIAGALVLIPIILLDGGLKNLWPAIDWVPIVPFAVTAFAAFAVIWTSTYVYLLYRKVVDYVPAE